MHDQNLYRSIKNDEESMLMTYKKLGIPPPALNGGLFTGEPFKKDAPYANIPIVPDAGYMIHYALRSANPPVEALYQYPGGFRPGNNTPIMPGVQKYKDGRYGVLCVNIPRKRSEVNCKCPKCVKHSFTKYYHL